MHILAGGGQRPVRLSHDLGFKFISIRDDRWSINNKTSEFKRSKATYNRSTDLETDGRCHLQAIHCDVFEGKESPGRGTLLALFIERNPTLKQHLPMEVKVRRPIADRGRRLGHPGTFKATPPSRARTDETVLQIHDSYLSRADLQLGVKERLQENEWKSIFLLEDLDVLNVVVA